MQFKKFYNIATKVSSRKKCYYFWWSTWLLSASDLHNAQATILNPFYDMEYKMIKKIKQN